ncbi:unnamed protein product [Schistosoma mansoni]|uniref:Smp_206150 n=1 Tax=Schistosoma mansoni TaxID=6183 RepID=UPI00022C873A|nr:unnamed protein product [Schistosoma mansoni]|eukprot:XP_018644817.1 unnamed protein product [Schistosoma mansoni]
MEHIECYTYLSSFSTEQYRSTDCETRNACNHFTTHTTTSYQVTSSQLNSHHHCTFTLGAIHCGRITLHYHINSQHHPIHFNYIQTFSIHITSNSLHSTPLQTNQLNTN